MNKLLTKALELHKEHGNISIPFLQRKFQISLAQATLLKSLLTVRLGIVSV